MVAPKVLLGKGVCMYVYLYFSFQNKSKHYIFKYNNIKVMTEVS